ncbi:MAG TPA: glycosyltransferase [Solirubrobacteraceae bacterium]|nr:glycosyltransferase [Solirubrobacteraceae bacterium]
MTDQTLTRPSSRPRPAGPRHVAPSVEIVVPVFNEQAALERSIRRLHRFLGAELPFSWRIVIADNASTDATPAIAETLARELPPLSGMFSSPRNVSAVPVTRTANELAISRLRKTGSIRLLRYRPVGLPRRLGLRPPHGFSGIEAGCLGQRRGSPAQPLGHPVFAMWVGSV